jgi:hypothetical protein
MTSNCLRHGSGRFEREFPCSPLPNPASSRRPGPAPGSRRADGVPSAHERTGQAIEAVFKERIDDHLRQLAITIVGARATRHCVSNRCQDVPRTSA